MSWNSSRSAKSKRSLDSNSGNSNNKKKRKPNQNPPNQKTLGMAWGSNSVSSSKSSSRRSNFTDFGSYMAIKNQKLQFQFDADAADSSTSGIKPLFHGVSIFVDGFTVPSSQELRGYMLKYGGRFENYFSRNRVTHIICSNLPDSKIKNIRSFSRGLPVVKPTWVLDSVAANKLLNWVPYQLDQLVDDTHKQPKLPAFFIPKTSSTFEDTRALTNCDSNIEEGYLPKSAISEGESSCEVGESVEYSSDSNKDMLRPTQEKVYGVSMDEPTEEKVSELTTPESSSHDIHVGKAFKSSPCKSSRSANVRLDDRDERSSSAPETVEGSNQCHSTLGDPNFVENYFKNSRLHFIGTWRNRYRKRFPNLPSRIKTGSSTANASSITQGTAVIHVDMDCFFVSVIIRKQPELQDKPAAVCHSDNPRGTAEISSANYPARDYGVRAGMFVRDAKARCPHLVIVPYNFEAYEVVADQFYDILHKHCSKVQAVSCDEAFLDVTDRADVDAEHIASVIRQEIYEATGCTASAGIAGNLLMARLTTRKAKPNGQFLIPPEKVEGFLDELPIKALPGIGHVLEEKFKRLQIQTCGQLRMISKEFLQKDFGSKTGTMLWNYSRGIDTRVVGVVQEAKSVGADVNWGVRFSNLQDSQRFLVKLCNEVSLRLQGCGVQGRTVTLKLKKKKKGAGEPAKYMGCGDCENLSHSMTIPVATDDVDVLQRISKQLFAYFHLDVKDIRGVGLHVSRLENVDMASQGNGRNSLKSWLSLASANMEELTYSSREKIDGELLLPGGQCGTGAMKLGKPNSDEDSCKFPKQLSSTSCQGQMNQLPSEASLSRDSTLPHISDLDIGVIESLPPEIFSEMNILYEGKLSEILEKNKDKDPKPSNSNNSSLTRKAGGERYKGKEHLLFAETNIEKTLSQTKGEQCRHREYQPASTSFAGSFNSHVASVGEDQTEFMPTSISQIDNSVLQELPEELKADILGLFPALRRPECSSSGVVESLHDKVNPENLEDHLEEESSVLTHNLWVGHPPEWVSKFEISNHLILNLLTDMYYKSGSIDLLSPILQNVISALPLFLDATKDPGDDVISCFYDLLQQYIDLKIDSDIEELYICFRLLKRFTEKSRFFLQLYDTVLPYLQASFSASYGGKLNI